MGEATALAPPLGAVEVGNFLCFSQRIKSRFTYLHFNHWLLQSAIKTFGHSILTIFLMLQHFLSQPFFWTSFVLTSYQLIITRSSVSLKTGYLKLIMYWFPLNSFIGHLNFKSKVALHFHIVAYFLQ